MSKKDRKILIFDTTLRDGEQSPGATMSVDEKLEIARLLEEINVDVIEAGFPISSAGDFEAVNKVAKLVKKPQVCGLARSMVKDIDAAYKALRVAKHPRIHVFLATSKIHMQHKLKKVEDEVIRIATDAVKYARKKISNVEFSPEDASRTDPAFLFKVLEAVIDAGATTVNIPDTVGYAVPGEFGDLIKSIKTEVSNIHKAKISVHCHNDLGLGVSNSLTAIANGADQIECTINGLGERAGNASLEEIVMALKVRKKHYKCYTDINTKGLYRISRLVSKSTGIQVQPNKAIVGRNAFAHESGIHQDGVIKKRITYEIISPRDVGFTKSNLVLGKHSGRHAFSLRLKTLGIHLEKEDFERAFVRFKNLADKKKKVFDDDLFAITKDEIKHGKQKFKLVEFAIKSGNKIKPVGDIVVQSGRSRVTGSSTGDGPIDACYKAIEKALKTKAKLQNYSISAATKGKDALGEVSLSMKIGKRTFPGRGASTDIVEASIKAYIDALNRAADNNCI